MYTPLGLLRRLKEMMCVKLLTLCLAHNKHSINLSFCYCSSPHHLTCSGPQIFGRADSETSRNPGFWTLEIMTQIPGFVLSHKLMVIFMFSFQPYGHFHQEAKLPVCHEFCRPRKLVITSAPVPAKTPSCFQQPQMHHPNLCLIKMAIVPVIDLCIFQS